jgi:type I phosphodiesterase/nucleotide pyrophosphatase
MVKSSARAVGLVLFTLVVGYLAAPIFIRVAPPPLVDNVKIVADDIYHAVDRTRKIPVELALPHIARAGISQFIKLLPLEKAVLARVQSRLARRDFVDELVPFLFMIRDMYLSSDEMDVVKFDEYVRSEYTPQQNLPGMEHSMFSWQPVSDTSDDEQDPETGFGLTLKLAAELVTLYDALYLVDGDDAEGVLERLACGNESMSARLGVTAARVKPTVKSVLQQVRAGMAADAELGLSLDGIITDSRRLETITLSLVHFMDLMVCKHYEMFASHIAREEQLAVWMNNELQQAGGGRLWNYLDQAQNRRNYGVMIAVDGLQGHLVETLATNGFQAAFIQSIAREQRRGETMIAEEDATRLAQQTEFLEDFVKHGFEHKRYLPFFKDLYEYSGTKDIFHPRAIAKGGISTTPTISVRNLPIIKTGAPVAGEGSTGVPNFHFVDRAFELNGVQQGRAYYFFGNDALQLTDLTETAGMKSLFERLPGLSSYSCAAQYDEYAQAGIDPFLNLALGEAVRDFGEVLCFKELRQRVDNELTLQALRAELLALRDRLAIDSAWYNWYQLWNQRTAHQRAKQLLRQIAELEARGLPQLLLYYNPWPDHFAHFKGPFADEIISPSGELARLDYWLGQLMQLYQQAGVSDRTVYGMAGDHGLAPVFELVSPQERVLTALEKQGVPLKIIKISSDEGEGPKLTHVLNPPSMRGYDVVIASTAGGNLMFDLFVDQLDKWAQQPVESDLRRWQPIAWQQSDSNQYIDLIDEMVTRLGDSLEYLVVRTAEGNSALRTDTALYATSGRAEITRRGPRIYYSFSGNDPLKLKSLSHYHKHDDEDKATHKSLYRTCVVEAVVQDKSSWCVESQWRQLASFTAKPDSIVQLAHLYDSDRAGTINLFPAQGVAFNSIVPGRHAGESFHEKDAFAGLWGAPIIADSADSGSRLQTALGGSIPTAIHEFLTGQPVTQGKDGWGYPSLWRDAYGERPITEQ